MNMVPPEFGEEGGKSAWKVFESVVSTGFMVPVGLLLLWTFTNAVGFWMAEKLFGGSFRRVADAVGLNLGGLSFWDIGAAAGFVSGVAALVVYIVRQGARG